MQVTGALPPALQAAIGKGPEQGDMGFAASFRFSVDPLELKPGAWLLVHVPDTLPPPVYAMLGHSIREHLKQNDREDVRVLIVNREFSISALSADDLASLGYVRLSDLPAGMPQ